MPLLTDSENAEWDNVAFSEFCQNRRGGGGEFSEEGVYHRMVRRDNFKLNYYHGQPCQLFDLNADPSELNDLVEDPAYTEVVKKLTTEVLAEWDPEAIHAKMEALDQDMAIQAAWTRHVQPPDSIRWTMKPEMSYLDDEQI